jgi:putative ABC transport system ATP-binding protein
LEAKAVTKSFGATPALQGATLAVARGEILAIMGPSGSGKSTLLYCMAGIIEPDGGEAWFDGERLDTLDEAERSRLRRTSVGFVFQFGQLVPELTAEENVALPLLLNGTRRKKAFAVARSWFPRLGIENLERQRTGEMSGGQGQRVAIARALAIEPPVLLADEPTGALDSLASEEVMELLVSIAREQGTTVAIVTHDPRVAAYADRDVILRDGRVTTASSPAAAAR